MAQLEAELARFNPDLSESQARTEYLLDPDRYTLVHDGSNMPFAHKLAARLGLPYTPESTTKAYATGEIQTRIKQPVVDKRVLIVGSPRPGNVAFDTRSLLDTAKAVRNGCGEPWLVMPWMPNLRDDHPPIPYAGVEAHGAKAIIQDIANAGITRAFTGEPHFRQAEWTGSVPMFPIPIRDYVLPLLQHEKRVLVAPDSSRHAIHKFMYEPYGVNTTYIDKKRNQVDGRIENDETFMDPNLIYGANVLIEDDMIGSGPTSAAAIRKAFDAGANSVELAVAHGLLTGKAVDVLMNSGVSKVHITNSIDNSERLGKLPDLFVVHDWSEQFAQAIHMLDQGIMPQEYFYNNGALAHV